MIKSKLNFTNVLIFFFVLEKNTIFTTLKILLNIDGLIFVGLNSYVIPKCNYQLP